MEIDVVIPAHDEQSRIGRTLDRYRHADLGGHARFIAALDGCRDRTAEIVRRHAMADPRVDMLVLPKLGKGGALIEAFRRCRGDIVAFVDADGATPPAELRRLIDVASRGTDVVIASRRHPASVTPCTRPMARKMASAGFAFGARRLFGLSFHDTQCGAKAMRRDALQRITPHLSSRDFLIDVDLLFTAQAFDFSVAEVPTIWLDQRGSRMRPLRDARRMFLSALRLWLHHHTFRIDASPDMPEVSGLSEVIDLRDPRWSPGTRVHADDEEDAERVAT